MGTRLPAWHIPGRGGNRELLGGFEGWTREGCAERKGGTVQ